MVAFPLSSLPLVPRTALTLHKQVLARGLQLVPAVCRAASPEAAKSNVVARAGEEARREALAAARARVEELQGLLARLQDLETAGQVFSSLSFFNMQLQEQMPLALLASLGVRRATLYTRERIAHPRADLWVRAG